MQNDNNMTKTSKVIFNDSFIPFIIKWGRGINLFGIILCFGPIFTLALMGIYPHWDALIAGLSIQLPIVISPYIYEPISYFAVLGIPGTYMSFLSGNISNLRVPASSVAQSAAGVAEGSDEGTIIATIGIAVSTFVNIIILTIGIVMGAYTLSKLPPTITRALNLLLPALFAALMANFSMNKPKLAVIGIPLAVVMVLAKTYNVFNFLPGALSSALPILITVFGTMGIGIFLAKKGKLD